MLGLSPNSCALPLLCSPWLATPRNISWQLDTDECDLTWVIEHGGMYAEASGQGFLLYKKDTPEKTFYFLYLQTTRRQM